MVKQRIQLKRKAPITRRIKTRDRPPRFQQNANQKTVVKVYNSFEKMRKRLPRKKAQNYRYRDTSRAPSFQSVKEANGNISSLGYTPASSNLIHLSNMQKLIEDKVINEIKMICFVNEILNRTNIQFLILFLFLIFNKQYVWNKIQGENQINDICIQIISGKM